MFGLRQSSNLIHDFLYNIYLICFAIPILILLTVLTAIVTIIGSLLGGAHVWGYYPGKIWSILICLFLLFPIKVKGREKLHRHTSYIFVPNHQGAFDIFLIYGFLGRNFKWMMKKSLRKIPFVGKACQSAGHIFVDRSGPKKVLETIKQAKASLVDGVSLVMFPEGARTFTGHMGYFKKGAFQLADELQIQVVPITIDGSFEIMPRTSKWIHRHYMILTIHDPIAPKGAGPEDIIALRDEAYQAVMSSLPEKHQGFVRNDDQ
jgi:1-acyl-sn-glycerol-3-phosphate acyltransferase